MNDLPDREPPRFWIAVSIFVVALALIVFMLVYTSTNVHAQEPIHDGTTCGPIDAVTQRFGEALNEHPLWGAASALGGQIVIFQTPDGATWSLFRLTPDGMACIIDSGASAVMFKTDKGV